MDQFGEVRRLLRLRESREQRSKRMSGAPRLRQRQRRPMGIVIGGGKETKRMKTRLPTREVRDLWFKTRKRKRISSQWGH